MTDSAQPIDYVIVVPPNEMTATFEVVAVNPGFDVLVASNPNRTASMDVVVL